ncbi:MAG TPA: SDR family NAD(P)-dependent oxidoreductase [Chloroflexota bacterium]|nr:SDR family NAD(P)-dependent oxidoreductase [Chloroflexota bacterium]
MSTVQRFAGRTALVTGASSGIGEAFARALAARGTALILSARNGQRLAALATELTAAHGIAAISLPADLSREGGAAALVAAVQERGLTVDLLVNNAGFSNQGPFAELDGAKEQGEIQVNVASVVALSRAFLPPMIERHAGAIVNVASVVAYFPLPYQGVYGASKAFVLSFSHSLAAELHGTGVQVLAVCPGTTATNFFSAMGSNHLLEQAGRFNGLRTPQQVAATALRALERGHSLAVDGAANRALTIVTGLLPAAALARVIARVTRPD